MSYSKGTAGYADRKESIKVSVVFGVITILILLAEFVFPSMLRDEVKAASTAWNIIGGILTGGSLVPLIVGAFSNEETKGFKIAWAVMVVLGIFCAAGWYDNATSYLNF